jgi:hypothetical protein
MASVAIHPPKTPITKGSNAIAKNTVPNVCKMPGPPAPFVPTPLPNIAKSGSSPKGYSKKVKVEGNAVCIRGASFESMGDVASKATGGGLVSANTHGPVKFVTPGSLTVKFEGKNVHLLGDPVLNNCGPSGSPPNSATMMGADQADSSASGTESDEEKLRKKCGEQRAKILEKDAKLGKELRKYDPASDALGGFKKHGGLPGPTVPGGHYVKIRAFQRGLKNDLTRFQKECSESGIAYPRETDQNANREVEPPPGMPRIPL